MSFLAMLIVVIKIGNRKQRLKITERQLTRWNSYTRKGWSWEHLVEYGLV